jgi:hypothetical protein
VIDLEWTESVPPKAEKRTGSLSASSAIRFEALCGSLTGVNVKIFTKCPVTAQITKEKIGLAKQFRFLLRVIFRASLILRQKSRNFVFFCNYRAICVFTFHFSLFLCHFAETVEFLKFETRAFVLNYSTIITQKNSEKGDVTTLEKER